MSVARSRHGVPHLVTSMYGLVVAVFSGVFGLIGHGAALGSTPIALPGTAASALGASAIVGGLTTAYSRRHSPAVAVGSALVLGQVVVHLVLASTPPSGRAPLGHTHAAAAFDLPVHASVWTPSMLAAHVIATTLALVILLATGRALSWIAARGVAASRSRAGRLAEARKMPVNRPRVEGVSALLLFRGGTRAPPCVA